MKIIRKHETRILPIGLSGFFPDRTEENEYWFKLPMVSFYRNYDHEREVSIIVIGVEIYWKEFILKKKTITFFHYKAEK